MNKNLIRVGAVAAIAFAAVGGLTACSNAAPAPTESAVGSNVVSPVQIPVAEANGKTYDIPMNSMGYLNVAEATEGDWTASFSKSGVVEFTEGGTGPHARSRGHHRGHPHRLGNRRHRDLHGQRHDVIF